MSSSQESDFSQSIDGESASVFSQSIDTASDESGASYDSEYSLSSTTSFDENRYVAIDFEFIAGHRKNSELIWSPLEQQMYKFNTHSKLGASYVCYEKYCNVRAYLKDGQCFKSRKSLEHLHGPNTKMHEEFIVKSEIKKKAIECKKMDLREIYNDVMSR